jgi:NAD(P) transhydrogenase subunit alpha
MAQAIDHDSSERRVAVTAETAKKLVAQGHTVRIPSGAGVPAVTPDAAYQGVGAEITDAWRA